jgi:PST family polysaccharide transporter
MKALTRSGNPDVARAFANIVWLGLERLTQIAVAIVISGLLARYFGPDDFGKWQYANTLLLVIAPLTWMCGAEILVPTIVNRTPADTGAVLGSAFVLRIGMSVIALALTWIWIAAGGPDPMVGLMLTGLVVTLLFRDPLIGVVNCWLQSMTYSKPQLIASMTAAIVKAALVFALVRLAAAPQSFGWLWALEAAAIGGALVVYYMRRHGGKLDWRFDRALFRHFASAGTVFWLGLI